MRSDKVINIEGGVTVSWFVDIFVSSFLFWLNSEEDYKKAHYK